MQNLELKAKYSNEEGIRLAKKLPLNSEDILFQVDTYFNIARGRLKLRAIRNKQTELIYYNRPDDENETQSHYEIYECLPPEQLEKILTMALGVKVIISKERKVFIYKDCRIHIDKVDNLGEFLEFEVVMIPGRTHKEALELMKFLKDHFKITDDKLISVSYSDLLLAKK